MRKIVLFLLLSFCSLAVWSAERLFSASGMAYIVTDDDVADLNIDALVLYNGMSAAELTYIGSEDESQIVWLDYDGVEQASGTKTIYPADGEGYILKVADEIRAYVWCIDYALYPAQVGTAEVVEADDRCDYIKLYMPNLLAPDLVYKDKTKASRTLPRTFSIVYDATEFSGDAWTEPAPKTFKKAAPFTELVFEAPLCNTEFVVSGDDWAEKLGLPVASAQTGVYKAIAVQCHLKAKIEERSAKNELDRSRADISGSGPLVVACESRANTVQPMYYEWRIFPTSNPSNYMRYSDTDLRYTFKESGDYRIVLTVASDFCEYSDSVDVKVLESSLEVPNVFTPNGDGINDEFRVAYKSLASYACYVYNRWGRLVFKSTDPGKGWDGNVNGRPAAPGAYYYIIQATGTDVDSDGNPVKYKFSGDINLLRTKSKN